MTCQLTTSLLILIAGLGVMWRVIVVAILARRAGWHAPWRFQAFAIAYALLGGLTADAMADALAGTASAVQLGFVTVSALLILTDRRSA